MFVVGGCRYSANYVNIAYPLSSSPHGGIYNKLPQFYQNYERELKEASERRRQANTRKERERWRKFAKKFAQGFFGFQDEDIPEEQLEPDYPYSVFGLKRSASEEDMKKAYRKSVLKAHPDRGGTAEVFRTVREAWEYFCNFVKV
tara:strand:+ start:361 stop:795 length:435 start_codon:yes stop_codon:yes gene_type:complete